MRKYLLIALAMLVAALAVQTGRLRRSKAEVQRLDTNQTALMSDVAHYRTRTGQEVASAQVLRLRVGEFERLRAADAAMIRDLGIKLRRVEATAKTAMRTEVQITAPLENAATQPTAWDKYGAEVRRAADSVKDAIGRELSGQIGIPEAKVFRWSDRHVSIEGMVQSDSVTCHIESVDTLRQVIHRVPKKFWFIRWGTKAIRQEIVSSNPHTRVVYAEYIKFEQ